MTAAAAELRNLPGVLTVLAAVLPVGTVRLHRAVAGRMRAFRKSHVRPPAADCSADAARRRLRDANAFGAGSLWALTLFERHGLPLAQLVEARFPACRIMEEVLGSVFRQDETKPLVAD